ncbi:hypothetical protein GCM10011345_08530 [Gemmobacter megaterium]|nr:hypothetical protein GCM10011345_08530 [Gemmobacter megaterium]
MGLIIGGIFIYQQASLASATQETTRISHGLAASVQGLVQNNRASDRARAEFESDDLIFGSGFPLVGTSDFVNVREKAIRLPYNGELGITCVGPEFMVMDMIFPNNYMSNQLCKRLSFTNDAENRTGVIGGNIRVNQGICNWDELAGSYDGDIPDHLANGFSVVYVQYFWENPKGSDLIGRNTFDGDTECSMPDVPLISG